MSHFGRSGPPDIKDTYSLLVLNITFRTSADDLFPLFEKYGKVVDVFIPRDRRTGESRGFAFVRYKYADEAQKAVEKLDGRVVDGREIMVQFAKYGPNAERIHKGRIVEPVSRSRGRSRSRSPRPRYRDEYRDRDSRKRSRSRSKGRYDRDRHREGIEIIALEAGAAVGVLFITKIVGEANMMMRGVVGVGLMKVPPLLGVPVLGGAALHAGHHLLEVEVQMNAMGRNALLLQRVFHHVVDLLILEAPLHVLMLMNEGTLNHAMLFLAPVLLMAIY
ncbi:hypothetical protein U1Q18_017522 [Sarracenia purpurea var. burkii]